ncbi:hypothetical protein KUL17_18790 [Alteromonas sp. KUL17]|nr:hypothetical protein KUL17_18790 [Alteromonas sp. KUL17]
MTQHMYLRPSPLAGDYSRLLGNLPPKTKPSDTYEVNFYNPQLVLGNKKRKTIFF